MSKEGTNFFISAMHLL